MRHTHYYEVTATDHYDFGLQLGTLFGNEARTTLGLKKSKENWNNKVTLAKKYLPITKKYFPQFIEEIKGYAMSSRISFSDFWTITLYDDLDKSNQDKCTTIVTNNGFLISHNEDWNLNSEDDICLLKKTLNGVTTFEFFYYNTLGCASICINSYGYITTINTMDSTDRQFGIPRDIVARWLSETKNIKQDFEKLKTLKRSDGYNYIFVTTKGDVWDLETTATQQVLIKPKLPYVHTNHYLSKELQQFESPDDSINTYTRYETACARVKKTMTEDDIIDLATDTSRGSKNSILNEKTIGRMVIDIENLVAKVWLAREKEKGWIDYQLNFLNN